MKNQNEQDRMERIMANSWKRHSSRIDDDKDEYLSPGYPTADDIPDECVIVPAEQADTPNYPDHPDDIETPEELREAGLTEEQIERALEQAADPDWDGTPDG